MKRFFIFSVMATAVFSCLYSRPIRQAKDTIQDTTLVLRLYPDPVSYTHLDVYKRQPYKTRLLFFLKV